MCLYARYIHLDKKITLKNTFAFTFKLPHCLLSFFQYCSPSKRFRLVFRFLLALSIISSPSAMSQSDEERRKLLKPSVEKGVLGDFLTANFSKTLGLPASKVVVTKEVRMVLCCMWLEYGLIFLNTLVYAG